MEPSLCPVPWIRIVGRRGKEKLPSEFDPSPRRFDGVGVRQYRPSETVRQIPIVHGSAPVDLVREADYQARCNDRNSVFATLTSPDTHHSSLQIEILHSQPEALPQPQPRPVEHACDQLLCPCYLPQNSLDFSVSQRRTCLASCDRAAFKRMVVPVEPRLIPSEAPQLFPADVDDQVVAFLSSFYEPCVSVRRPSLRTFVDPADRSLRACGRVSSTGPSARGPATAPHLTPRGVKVAHSESLKALSPQDAGRTSPELGAPVRFFDEGPQACTTD